MSRAAASIASAAQNCKRRYHMVPRQNTCRGTLKHLIECKMRVRLVEGTFVRSYKGATLYWNCHTNSYIEFACADDVSMLLTKDYQSVDGILNRLQKSCSEVSALEIGQGLQDFLKTLAETGMVEFDSQTVEKNAVAGDADSYVANWYLSRGLPQELHLDVTSACTERCQHCYWPTHEPLFVAKAIVIKSIAEFAAMQGMTVCLSGGEPMMHPEFWEICELCQENCCAVEVLSNLTLCTEKMATLLEKLSPTYINVSVYSMDPLVHDNITRVKGSWHKTMEGIARCRNRGLTLRIATPVLKMNVNDIDGVEDFANTNGMAFVPNVDILPKANCKGVDSSCLCNSAEMHTFLLSHPYLAYKRRHKTDTDKVCNIGMESLYVDPSGNYYPCGGMHNYVLGNVATSSMSDVWYGSELNRLRDIKLSDFVKCKECNCVDYCKVCPAYNYNATGNIFLPSESKCEMVQVAHALQRN